MGNLTFEQAIQRLEGQRHKQVMQAAADIDRRLGIKSDHASAIGAWKEGAENSIVIQSPAANPTLARAAAAMKGYVANQKSVLVFEHGDPDQLGKRAETLELDKDAPVWFSKLQTAPFESAAEIGERISTASAAHDGVTGFVLPDGSVINLSKDDHNYAANFATQRMDGLTKFFDNNVIRVVASPRAGAGEKWPGSPQSRGYLGIELYHPPTREQIRALNGFAASHNYDAMYMEGGHSSMVEGGVSSKGMRDALLSSWPQVQGEHVLASFEVKDKAEDLHDRLLKDGVEFHTIEPLGGDRYKVHVFASDQSTVDAVQKVARHYGSQVTAARGHGDFIGAGSDEGSDAQQRGEARRAYEKVIADAAATPGLENVADTWSDVRHRWRTIADQAARWIALFDSFFDEGPGHPFRGNQYTTGQSGGGLTVENPPWTFAGGPHGERWQNVADQAVRQWHEDHPRVEAQTIALRQDLDQAMASAAKYTNMKDWYADHKEIAKRIFGEDESLFERFLAAASINSAGQDNVNRALNAYVHYKLGGSFDPENYSGVMKLEMEKYNEIVRGEALGGEKLDAFDRALRGDWNQVPADRHMKRLLFKDPATKGGTWQNAVTRVVVQAFAKKMGWKPAQLQAAMWAVAKARSPKGLPSIIFTYRQYLQKQEARMRAVMHTVHAFGSKMKPKIPALADAAELFDISLGDKLADAYRDARLLVELADVLRHHSQYFGDEEAGHPFRGNQYVSGVSGSAEEEEKEDTRPKSWDDLSSRDQEHVENSWREENYEREMRFQIDNWHQSGDALDDAKEELTDIWNNEKRDRDKWGEDTLDQALESWNEDHDQEIPYTNGQLRQAIELEHERGYSREDVKISFNDDKLQKPTDVEPIDPRQLEFPGMPAGKPDYSKHLTPEMREHLTEHITEAFNDQASDMESEIDPPDFSETVNETLDQIWHEMDDKEKFDWAKRNTDIVEPESDKPRGPLREFPKEEPRPSPIFITKVQNLIRKVIDPRLMDNIKFDDHSSFEISGWGLTKPMGATSRSDNQIKFYIRNMQGLTDKQIEGIALHESMHAKFNDVSDAMGKEFAKLEKDVGEETLKMITRTGVLSERNCSQYPTACGMLRFQSDKAKDKLINEVHDHPVSPYSNMYWAQASQRPTPLAINIAVHETFAEMARREHEDGKLPDNIPTWVGFYKTVNDLWEKAHARA